MPTWPTQRYMRAFYDNPDGTPLWEAKHLVVVKPPYKLTYAGEPSSGFRVHRKVAADLVSILNELWDAAHHDQRVADEWGISLSSGGYHFRKVRGGRSLSTHGCGAAIDMDAGRNPLGHTTGNFRKYPVVYETFEKHGWVWGGRWTGRPDCMHFQAARV
jgi:hypothetical protein